eukprot:401872_1
MDRNINIIIIVVIFVLGISIAFMVYDITGSISLNMMSFIRTENNKATQFEYCNKDNSNQIYILYLCQGSPIDIIPSFYYHFFNNSFNDLIFLDYKGTNGTDTGQYKLFRPTDHLSHYNHNKMTFTVIHYPNNSDSSWIEGRNYLIFYAFNYEKLIKKCKYNYWSILDDDIDFIGNNSLKYMHSFESLLLEYQPAIAVPNLIDMYYREPYNNNTHKNILLQNTNCVEFRNDWICPIANYDPMITYFHREVIDNKLIIPYPHPWKIAYQAWWCYHYYSMARITVLYRNYIILYNGLKMNNKLHRPYYRGGVVCLRSTMSYMLNISVEFNHCFNKCINKTMYNCGGCQLPVYGKTHGIIQKKSMKINYTLFNWTNIDPNHCKN